MEKKKIEEAFDFAFKRHVNQTRKDGTPYINHPYKVAEIVRVYFENDPYRDELIVAAYLHDTLEDTDTTLDEIKDNFGEYVAYLVNGVTNDKELKKKMGKTDYLCHKIVNMDNIVLNLKLCDRLANIIDAENAPEDFRDKYITETLTVLHYLINNRNITSTQKDIIKEINHVINVYRKNKIIEKLKK